MTIRNVLSIAGSDPSGGAGIQGDLKAFSANGVYGMAVITALTAQNTRSVTGVVPVDPDCVIRQIDTVFEDVRVDAVKIGMIANAEIARAVATCLKRWQPANVVLDPVMIAKSGDALLAENAVNAVREELLPLSTIVTPNLPEAAVLLGEDEATSISEMQEAAKRLLGLGPRGVLVKGGHLEGDASPDAFASQAGLVTLEGERIATANTHGTGCTLSSAIAARLAITGDSEAAVREAKAYVRRAIEGASQLSVGSGHGPTHHFVDLWPAQGGV